MESVQIKVGEKEIRIMKELSELLHSSSSEVIRMAMVEGVKIFDLNAPYVKHLRNRITIRLNSLKQIEPYVSAEIFQLFTPYLSPQFEYYRIVAGIRYEPGRFGEFKVAWGFNRELASPEPAMIYMFKINYTYEL